MIGRGGRNWRRRRQIRLDRSPAAGALAGRLGLSFLRALLESKPVMPAPGGDRRETRRPVTCAAPPQPLRLGLQARRTARIGVELRREADRAPAGRVCAHALPPAKRQPRGNEQAGAAAARSECRQDECAARCATASVRPPAARARRAPGARRTWLTEAKGAMVNRRVDAGLACHTSLAARGATTSRITAMPPSLSLRQGIAAKFSPPALLEDVRRSPSRSLPASPGNRRRSRA